jgi:hypothetical protein
MEELKYNELQEKIVDILVSKTGNEDRSFFRVMVAYKFAEISTNMRCTVEYAGSKNIPTNVYALDLAPSGYSKNASMNVLEKEIFRKFRDKFMMATMPDISFNNLALIANDYSLATGLDIKDAKHQIDKEYNALPKFLYSFGSSTPEGFKAMRAKLSMSGIGATNNIIDEIGSNLTGNQETMTVQLEAYDTGDSKQKLIKSDGGNSDLRGSVPSNLFAFGTQSKLLDGSTIEKQFFELLETGYARRFIVGFVEHQQRDTTLSAEEMYDRIMSPTVDLDVLSLSSYFEGLADESLYGKKLIMSKDTTIALMQYRLDCDNRANSLREHEGILEAVLRHSYWRALKVAGAYAFVMGESSITLEILNNAIALIEDSTRCFKSMLARDKPYVRLAKYIAGVDKKVTQVDLLEDLAFYRGSETQKRELLQLAIAYGYNNNIIIKNTIKDGVEFFQGESLEETDISKINCSWSKDITEGYKPAVSSFANLHQLVSAKGFHYCNHSFKDGYRKSENALEGFNLLILDVDSGLPIEVCKSLLNDYTFMIATTKRHTNEHNRYRIILPMSHRLKLNPNDYKQFMKNVFSWLPFDSDEQTSDIARKWESFAGTYSYNTGKLFDVMDFIPNTPKENKYRDRVKKIGNSDTLQRWFLINYKDEDGRNNICVKYALALLDDGMSSENIRHSLYDFNSKLEQPLSELELESTVMKTIIKKEYEKELAN